MREKKNTFGNKKSSLDLAYHQSSRVYRITQEIDVFFKATFF